MQKTFTTDDVTVAMCPRRRWRSWSIGATRDARRHHPAVHRVAQGRWPAPQDKSDLQCLAFRAASCVACRL